MIAKILSKQRPIINISINGKTAPVLIDTGASMSILDICQKKNYDFDIRNKMNVSIIGVGGKQNDAYHVKNANIDLQGIPLYQFATMDISNVVESIHKATGIRVSGILGTGHIKLLEMKIDLENDVIKIGY